jgi:hypothetical protein
MKNNYVHGTQGHNTIIIDFDTTQHPRIFITLGSKTFMFVI